MNYPKLLQSSVNSNKLGLTVKGLIASLIPAIIMVAGALGVSLAETDVATLVENITALISLAMVVYGGIRKIVVSFNKRKNK